MLFEDNAVWRGPKACQPFDLTVLIFPISDVTAVKKPPGFDGAVEVGSGPGGRGVVLLLTVGFFGWRFRLPRDSAAGIGPLYHLAAGICVVGGPTTSVRRSHIQQKVPAVS